MCLWWNKSPEIQKEIAKECCAFVHDDFVGYWYYAYEKCRHDFLYLDDEAFKRLAPRCCLQHRAQRRCSCTCCPCTNSPSGSAPSPCRGKWAYELDSRQRRASAESTSCRDWSSSSMGTCRCLLPRARRDELCWPAGPLLLTRRCCSSCSQTAAIDSPFASSRSSSLQSALHSSDMCWGDID